MGEKSMKKIYIVTAGEYSDYHIERVFLSKGKAKNYAKYHQGDVWGGMRVETHTLADEGYSFVKMGYWEVTTQVGSSKREGPRPFYTGDAAYTKATLGKGGKKDKTVFDLTNRFNEYLSSYKYSLKIYITRYYPESVEEEEAKLKNEKIAYDIFAEINNHIVEGEDVEDVIEMMREKYR